MALQAQAQPTRQPTTAPPEISKLQIEERIKLVVENAAPRLPASVGRQLLTLIEPKSLAVVAGVVGVWAGAQFFGIGELADVVLLIGGWAMFGTDQAGILLARAVTLIGVQGTLAILLDKPSSAMKTQFFAVPEDPDPLPWDALDDLPTNRWWGYKPSTRGVLGLPAGEGETRILGDIEYSLAGSKMDRRMARAHELVHQLLTPKLRVLRRLRMFMQNQGYNRSYLLRYLEEAMAETYAQLRVKGFSKANLIRGVRFPIGRTYMVTVGDIGGEIRQIFLGPITVGGMTYQVWAARRSPQKSR